MSLARFTLSSFFIANVLAVVVAPISSAQSESTVHSGNVNQDVFRIRRATPSQTNSFTAPQNSQPKLFGTIEKSKILPTTPLIPMDPSTDMVRDNDYATPPPQPFRMNPIPASTMMNQAIKKPEAKYMWQQSAAGGYYDASGQTPDLVMGDQLYKYGGKFADGTVVPTTPVVCNFKGHVYKPYIVKR